MKRKLVRNAIYTMTIAIILISTIPLIACGRLETVFAWYDVDAIDHEGSKGFQVVLNAGETLTVDESHFAFSTSGALDFDVIELKVHIETQDNVVSLSENVITGIKNGRAEIEARVSGTREVHNNWSDEVAIENVMWGFIIGEVFVVDEDNMTEIWSAYDLDNIRNDLRGSFILRADIDLSYWDNWTPIGKIGGNWMESPYAFSGIFINPNSYVINNMTIIEEERIHHVGLFGFVKRGYISGIELSDIYIRASGCSLGNFVGGLAASTFMSRLENNHVDGEIFGGPTVGGLVGISRESVLIGNSFSGIIGTTNISLNRVYAGGIVGEIGQNSRLRIWHLDLVINNEVVADIEGCPKRSNLGGIIGGHNSADTLRLYTSNNTFSGQLVGFRTDELIAWVGAEN